MGGAGARRRAPRAGLHGQGLILPLLGACLRLAPPEVVHHDRSVFPLAPPAEDPGRWYVPGSVEGLGPTLWFVDTGYTHTTCDDDLAQALRLEVSGRGHVRSEQGPVRVGRAELPPFLLGGHRVEGLACLVRDLGTTSSLPEPAALPVAGVLGLDLLSRFRVEVDAGRSWLALSAPGVAIPEGAAPLRVAGRRSLRALVEVAVGDRSSWMLLDTGTALTWADGPRWGWAPTPPVGGRTVHLLQEARVAGRPVGPLAVLQRDRGPLGADLLGLDALAGHRLILDATQGRIALLPAGTPPGPSPTDPLPAARLEIPVPRSGYPVGGGAPW